MHLSPSSLRRFAVGLLLLPASLSWAAEVTWNGGDATWDQPDANSFNAAFGSGDDVIFGNVGVGAVAVGAGVTPGSVSFSHTSGTYTFSGTAYSAGASLLDISGGGIVQFGNLTNTSYTPTWGATTIAGGSTLNFTRGAGFLGSSGAQLTLDQGTLRVGTDNSATVSYNNPVAVLAGGGMVTAQWTSNQSNLAFSGAFTGAGALTLRAAGSSGNLANAGLIVSGSDNSGYTGAATIESANLATAAPVTTRPTAVIFTNAGSLLSGASSVTVRDGGLLGVEFAVTDANLANVSAGPRGGIAARGASGTLAGLTNVMDYIGAGGFLVLDNFNGVGNRLSDSSALALDNVRMDIIGRNASGGAVNEMIGALTVAGSNHLFLNRRNTTNAGVVLRAASLAVPGAGATLLIETSTGGGEFGTGAAASSLAVVGAKPASVNGMITPAIQHFTGGNNQGNFLTWDSTDTERLIVASYTGYAGDWAAAGATEIVSVNAATTLSGTGALDVHALRFTSSGANNLGGRTINIGSGGMIMSNTTISNGALNFGAVHGVIGAYNGSSQGTISASLAGNTGVTILGSTQALNLTSGNAFTGGLWINGGTVGLGHANAANGNNVVVNAFGRLTTNVSAGDGAVIGGLSGDGRVAANFQSSGTRILTIAPASGTHTFNGRLANGDGGMILAVNKGGNGTQVFGVNSLATHTGATTVTAGVLRIDGNFSTATGVVTVNGGTLGGSGTIGGATTIGALGTLAPGSSPGALSFASSLTLGGAAQFEINGASRGVLYDAVNVGSLLTYGGSLEAAVGFTLVDPSYTFQLFSFDSQTGQLDGLELSGLYTGSLDAGNNWLADIGGYTWSFDHGTGALSAAVIPEPATVTLLLGCGALLGALAFRRRRR